MNTKFNEEQSMNQVHNSVQAFTELLTEGVPTEEIKKVFSELYFSYSQLIIRHPDDVRYDALEQLYYLTRVIDALGKKQPN